MQITNITNNRQNFRSCTGWETYNNEQLPEPVTNHLSYLIDILNKTEAKTLKVFMDVGRPNRNAPQDYYVKLKTNIIDEDLAVIQEYNPDYTKEMYRRKSKWFRLDKTLIHEALEFLRGQNGFIHRCKKDPNHNPLPYTRFTYPEFARPRKNSIFLEH